MRELEVQLRVGDARQRDVGRGIARIDQKTMQRLNISAGDVVEIVSSVRQEDIIILGV